MKFEHIFPSFHKTLRSIQNDSGRDYVDESDLARLLNMIIIDCHSQLGFSLASFVRQAISLRESWLGDVCVRGCLLVVFFHFRLSSAFPVSYKMRTVPGNPEQNLTRCAPSPEFWTKPHKTRPIPRNPEKPRKMNH